MAKTGCSLSWGGFDKALGNAAKHLANTRALMESIGDALVTGVKTRLLNEVNPKGEKWEPSARALSQGGKTLTDTARLRDSIDYAATPTKVMVGSNLRYARIHQFGGIVKPRKGKFLKFRGRDGKDVFARQVKIPARPYLGVSEEDKKEVQATIQDFLAGALRQS